MDNNTKKTIKSEIRLQELEIRKFLLAFDPLGIGEGCPEDEYDDLVHNIISILNRRDYASKDKLALLTARILEYSDLSIKYRQHVLIVTEKIMKWWQARNYNT